ncbi:MAG TPA: alpha/beta hydrolase [Nocardioidaceae bacterium]|nr:alpha/beta hydrolase [Nocardioidaceae bacterium]
MPKYVHTPEFRGGSGDPMVLLNGGINTWTSWEPQLPFLTKRFDVLAPTHIGNAGTPSLPPDAMTVDTFVDAVEAAMDRAGFAKAHVAGYSLGGWVAMELARRGRALSVYAFAPAGGWESEASLQRIRRFFARVSLSSRYGKYGVALVAWIPAARHVLLHDTNAHGERMAPDALIRLIHEVAESEVPRAVAKLAFQPLEPYAHSGVPVTIAWPEHDRLLPYEYYGKAWREAAPFAQWKTVPGVGHVPTYDEPELIAQQIIAAATG